MNGALAIVLGGALGIIGTLPALVLFERALVNERTPSVAMGLAGTALSFMVLSVALLVVRVVSPNDVLAFGVAMAVSFLVAWTIEALRAWRAARHDSSSKP